MWFGLHLYWGRGNNLESILLISPVADLYLSFRMQECKPPCPQDAGKILLSMGDGIRFPDPTLLSSPDSCINSTYKVIFLLFICWPVLFFSIIYFWKVSHDFITGSQGGTLHTSFVCELNSRCPLNNRLKVVLPLARAGCTPVT
jgi:hypothetical protein